MAIANLQETIQGLMLQKSNLQLKQTQLQAQKTLSVSSQGDVQSLLSCEKNEIRNFFKDLYNSDETLQAEYLDYTDIPDFEEEMDKITAKFQDELDDLAAWETSIDAQITTNSTELEEINVYIESYKSMLSTNIQGDFTLGQN